MAKMTALQLVNRVLQKIGEPSSLTVLTSLTQIQQDVFDNINQALEEIAQECDLKPLEASGTFTLVTSTSTYTASSDYRKLAYESIRQTNDKNNIRLITPDEWDQMFPQGITSDRQGYPDLMTEVFGVFQIDKLPTANENTKVVNYRYFKIPTLLSTATATGTCYIAEGFDRTLLVSYAAWLQSKDFGHPQVSDFYLEVFGDPSNKKPEGMISKYKRTFTQPFLKPRVTYKF